jgi:hypothetical protein
MMQRRRWGLVLALAAVAPLACSSGDDEHAPPASAGTPNAGRAGASAASGTGAEGGDDVGGSAGRGDRGDAGDANIGHIGGGGSLSIGGAPAVDDPLCGLGVSWGDPVSLPVVSSVDADERLLSLTHDALTIVFTRDDVPMVADRAVASENFATPVPLLLPAGYSHEHGVALHPDGLGLVIVSHSGGFADIGRATRGGPFDGPPSDARFVQLADNAAQYGASLASPVLSASGTSLYFTQVGASSSKVFHAQGTTLFPVPALPEDLVTLGGMDGDLKLTLSVSADERTLFFFDEALGHAAGLWSAAPGAPFYELAEFEGLQSVFTDAGCERLYGTRMVGGSLDVVLEAPQ